MDTTTFETIWQAAIGLGIVAGGAYTGLQAQRAKREATRAANNAHPVSNGWGTKVGGDLSYLRESVDRVHTRMDAMDRRQLGADEQRADIRRTAAEQSAAVAAALTAHLATHARTDARQEAHQ